jgi:hypothetical protein
MKSFKQYIIESPIEYEIEDETPSSTNRPIIGKNVKKFAMMDSGVLKIVKPKKIGSIQTEGGDYTFHHHTYMSSDPFSKVRNHHIYISDKSGTIVGLLKGRTIAKEADSKSEHIQIDMSAIDKPHRGRGLYGEAIKAFIGKTPHVVYSDVAQTPAAKKTWMSLAASAEEQGHDLRVHPFMGKSPNSGIPWNKPLDQRFWEGGETPQGFVKPENILFSIRKKI